jgi:DNA polymerase III subunit epsilon
MRRCPRAATRMSEPAHRVSGVTAECPAWTDRLTVFDLETTGIDVEISRIVSAHVGVLDSGGALIERRDWLVDPGVDIPDAATAVHGITTVRARALGESAPDAIAAIVEGLREGLAAGRCLVAYNAAYDLTLLNREAIRYGIPPLTDPAPVIDPYIIDKAIDRYRPGKRTLGMTAAHYGVLLDDAHDAGADAIAAGRLALAVARRNPWLASMPAHELHTRQVRWCHGQAESYQAWRRGNGEPEFTASGAWPER